MELGSKRVVFTDAVRTDSMVANIQQYINRGQANSNSSSSSSSDIDRNCSDISNSSDSGGLCGGGGGSGSGSDIVRPSAVKFVQFNWNDDPPEDLLTETNGGVDIVWDSLLCSDVLYDAKNHACFLKTLRGLKFNRCFLAYKRRHDQAEELIFEAMSAFFYIHVFDSSCIALTNIDPKLLTALYIVYITPKNLSINALY